MRDHTGIDDLDLADAPLEREAAGICVGPGGCLAPDTLSDAELDRPPRAQFCCPTRSSCDLGDEDLA